MIRHKFPVLFFVFLFCRLISAQTENFKQSLNEVETQEQILAKCHPRRIRISHFCFDFCPTNLAKPFYPAEAKRLRLKGLVKVEVIVDKQGKVGYASVSDGAPYLSQAAQKAAYRSTFYAGRDCENNSVKFRATIIYNFH